MNRRDILKRIAVGAPALAVTSVMSMVAATAESPIHAPSNTPDDFMFHGWRLMWGGWRDLPNVDVRAGFWTAYGDKRDQWHLYSAWPGKVGPFVRGGVLDISLQADQVMPVIGCSDKEMLWFRNECLERLKRAIVKVGPPPLDMERWRAQA